MPGLEKEGVTQGSLLGPLLHSSVNVLIFVFLAPYGIWHARIRKEKQRFYRLFFSCTWSGSDIEKRKRTNSIGSLPGPKSLQGIGKMPQSSTKVSKTDVMVNIKEIA